MKTLRMVTVWPSRSQAPMERAREKAASSRCGERTTILRGVDAYFREDTFGKTELQTQFSVVPGGAAKSMRPLMQVWPSALGVTKVPAIESGENPT